MENKELIKVISVEIHASGSMKGYFTGLVEFPSVDDIQHTYCYRIHDTINGFDFSLASIDGDMPNHKMLNSAISLLERELALAYENHIIENKDIDDMLFNRGKFVYVDFDFNDIFKVHEEISRIACLENDNEAIVSAFHFLRYYTKSIKAEKSVTGYEATVSALKLIRSWMGNEEASVSARINYLWGNIPA